MTTLPGDTVGDDTYPIWVPNDDTPLVPLQALFIAQANSMVTQLNRLNAQRLSTVSHTDKFTPGGDWKLIDSTLTVYGEQYATFFIELQRLHTAVSVPSDGNLANLVVGQLDGSWGPDRQTPLVSSVTGRVLHGYVLATGEVKIAAINSGSDIAVNDHITLGGGFVMNSRHSAGI